MALRAALLAVLTAAAAPVVDANRPKAAGMREDVALVEKAGVEEATAPDFGASPEHACALLRGTSGLDGVLRGPETWGSCCNPGFFRGHFNTQSPSALTGKAYSEDTSEPIHAD